MQENTKSRVDPWNVEVKVKIYEVLSWEDERNLGQKPEHVEQYP